MAQAWITGDRFLSPRMVCEIVPGLSTAVLEDLRKKKRGPVFHKPTARLVIYRESDIIDWVLASKIHTRP